MKRRDFIKAGSAAAASTVAPEAAAPEATEAPAAAPAPAETAATAIADSRGRMRVSGTCSAGEASGTDLRCSTRRNGGFRCTGRDFAAGQEVHVTCQ